MSGPSYNMGSSSNLPPSLGSGYRAFGNKIFRLIKKSQKQLKKIFCVINLGNDFSNCNSAGKHKQNIRLFFFRNNFFLLKSQVGFEKNMIFTFPTKNEGFHRKNLLEQLFFPSNPDFFSNSFFDSRKQHKK